MTSSDSRYYTPIALPTAASNRTFLYIYTSHAQFGFKAFHGTAMAMFYFKESVKIQICSESVVFVWFLDTTMVFVRVNHTKLFNNLKMSKIPDRLNSMLSYWYSGEKHAVRWGNASSSYFEISTGIRQEDILYTILKTLYADSLSR